MTYRVLYVDGEPSAREGFRQAFRHCRFDVYTAGSARLALELLADVEIHVIVANERMPKMTGAEFLGRVRRAHPDTVRIMLTGQATAESATRAINEGAIFRFLTKPMDASVFEQLVDEALASLHPQQKNRRAKLEGALESRHPGITAVHRDAQGAILLDEALD